MNLLIPAVALAAVAAVPSAARDRDEVPAATFTGRAVSCIPLRAIRDTPVRNDRVIDFMTTSRRGYRVTLDSDCPQLGFNRAFYYRTSLSSLCQQDIITVLQQAGGLYAGASCGLAPFQPIELADPRRNGR